MAHVWLDIFFRARIEIYDFSKYKTNRRGPCKRCHRVANLYLINRKLIHINILIFNRILFKLSLTCFSQFCTSTKTNLISGRTSPLDTNQFDFEINRKGNIYGCWHILKVRWKASLAPINIIEELRGSILNW